MPEFTSFSYSKLTLLQVQGARDRSGRQVELSQAANRFQTVRSEWHKQLARSMDYANQSQELILPAIVSAFSDRDISPFMVDRLVKLCRAELRANVAWQRGLVNVKADCQADIDWWKKQRQNEESDKLKIVQELQAKMRATQLEIQRIQLRLKIQELQSRLQQAVKEQQQHHDHQEEEELAQVERRLSLGSDENDCSYFVPMVIIDKHEKGDDKKQHGEWVEIDEDYFQASTSGGGGSSDWVLCS